MTNTLSGKKQVETISIETPVAGDETLTIGDTIEDPNADTYNYCELNIMQIIVRTEIDKLPPKERIYTYYRYYEKKTISEVGKIMGWGRGETWNIRCSVFNILRKSEVIQEVGQVYEFRHAKEYLSPESIILAFEDSELELI